MGIYAGKRKKSFSNLAIFEQNPEKVKQDNIF
jgi:hypothetical protein